MNKVTRVLKSELGDASDIIVVPDLKAVDLTAATKKVLRIEDVNPDYEKWDFYLGIDGNPISGPGKSFEIMTWEPKRRVSSEEVRRYFWMRGFSGRTGAFTALVKERDPKGYHTSIPDDNGCWRRFDSELFAPYYYSDGGGIRNLDRNCLSGDWLDCWVFVAFREVIV